MDEDEVTRAWIDSASYHDLLRKWRFARGGESFCRGELGRYYMSELYRRRIEIGSEKHLKTCADLGYQPPRSGH